MNTLILRRRGRVWMHTTHSMPCEPHEHVNWQHKIMVGMTTILDQWTSLFINTTWTCASAAQDFGWNDNNIGPVNITLYQCWKLRCKMNAHLSIMEYDCRCLIVCWWIFWIEGISGALGKQTIAAAKTAVRCKVNQHSKQCVANLFHPSLLVSLIIVHHGFRQLDNSRNMLRLYGRFDQE